jgi:hypothetical protein
LIESGEIFNAINKGNKQNNHHAKPHGYMKIKVTNSFVKDRKFWNFEKKSGDYGIY